MHPANEAATEAPTSGNSQQVDPLHQAPERGERLLALHEVTLAISAQESLSHVLPLVVEHAGRLVSAESGALFLWDERARALRCVHARNRADWYEGVTVQYGEGLAGTAFATGEPLLVDDYQTWPGSSELGRQLGIRAAISVPLRAGERLLGACTLNTFQPGRRFTEDDAWVSVMFAQQAALAIVQARLLEQNRRRSSRLLALHRVATSILSARDESETIDLLLAETIRLLAADVAIVYATDPQTGELRARRALGAAPGSYAEVVRNDRGIVGEMLHRRGVVRVDDYQTWPRAVAEAKADGAKSIIAAPLFISDALIGALVARSRRTEGHFDEEDEELLETLARHAALALEQHRLRTVERRGALLEGAVKTARATAHEVNQPLSLVMGYAELLRARKSELDEPLVRTLSEIHVAAGRVAEQIHALERIVRFEEYAFPGAEPFLDIARSIEP
jgi:GAF domain-containing protein